MTREEWLEARRRGIGGSDVSAIMGLNPYRSALSIYMDKVGAVPVDASEMSEQAYWGTVLEEPIARRFAELHPELTVRRNNNILINSDYPFAIANIDREIRDGNETYGLEIKTVGIRSAKFWEDNDVPLAYVLQVSHYMMVTGWQKFIIAALVGGRNTSSARLRGTRILSKPLSHGNGSSGKWCRITPPKQTALSTMRRY